MLPKVRTASFRTCGFWSSITENNGWIIGNACWVAKKPSVNATVIGIIKYKAAVTVEDAKNGWMKIIFAPIRDPKTWKFIDCTECYIQEENFSKVFPLN